MKLPDNGEVISEKRAQQIVPEHGGRIQVRLNVLIQDKAVALRECEQLRITPGGRRFVVSCENDRTKHKRRKRFAYLPMWWTPRAEFHLEAV